MLGDIARFLIDTLLTLFGAALLLRAWMQAVRLPPYNPISRSIFQITNWLVLPLRRVIPGVAGIDWASLIGAWLTALTLMALLLLVAGVSPLLMLPSGLFLALLTVLKWGITLLMWMTLLMAVMSWINPHTPAMHILQHLVAPFLRPIQRALPSLGGLDLSPLVLLLATQIALMVLARASAMPLGL